MAPNPFLGVFLHALGGVAAGSFYVPLKNIKKWAWESFWLVMGLSAWLIVPWFVASITTPDLLEVLARTPTPVWLLTMLFGAFWGLGNLTFGLSVRHLGMALGYAIALGFCMTFGTLVPPVFQGKIGTILGTTSGLTIVAGVAICLAGIGLCGWAGMRKESELTEAQKRESVAEFTLGKGFVVATMSGILSACFAFGLAAGKPIAEISIKTGTIPLYSNNAVLVVILLGGFLSNATWCLVLNLRNSSFSDYVSGSARRQIQNYLLSSLGGAIWYGQFFFYGMGNTKLGEKFDFSSWSIHMAFIIVFSNLWGVFFHEWRGTSRRTKLMVCCGLLTLVGSTIVIGYGNYLAR